jgi:hypothetical protein
MTQIIMGQSVFSSLSRCHPSSQGVSLCRSSLDGSFGFTSVLIFRRSFFLQDLWRRSRPPTTGLSSFTTCTHDKYNHSRLYGQSLNLNSYGPNPRVMKAGEHREDKEGECFVRFAPSGGLTLSGITVKVRTCEERKRFRIRVSRW